MNSRLIVPVIVTASILLGIGNIIFRFSRDISDDYSENSSVIIENNTVSFKPITTEEANYIEEEYPLTTQEIDMFNSQFIRYEGIQTGLSIRALMGRLISNASTNDNYPKRIPALKIDAARSDGSGTEHAIIEIAGEIDEYINACGRIRNSVETKHEYYVTITYQESGIIDYIQISYDSENPILENYHR